MNTSQPATPTITDLVAERLDLEAEIEPLQARLAEINKHLAAENPGTYQAGGVTLTVSPQRRFNPRRFAEAFPYETHPHLYKHPTPAPDTQQIAPAIKDMYSDTHDNRITIK